jgi:hypothetical protein
MGVHSISFRTARPEGGQPPSSRWRVSALEQTHATLLSTLATQLLGHAGILQGIVLHGEKKKANLIDRTY